MPRTARVKSNSGVYHTIIRGVNKQNIFECSEDYEYFVHILRNQTMWVRGQVPDPVTDALSSGSDTCPLTHHPHCAIYAYCLMSNHVHLLIKECDEPIGDIMKRITSSYAKYYNRKYGRIGHLFQERFKSQPVNDWNYFITLIRYIHQNPIKAHIVKDLKDFLWCSWPEYLGKKYKSFCATQTVLDRICLQDLSVLIGQPLTDDEELGFIDIESDPVKTFFTDDEIWQILSELCNAHSLDEFQALTRPEQKQYLQQSALMGIGPRELSRLTGVPYSVVQRATSTKSIQANVLNEESPEDALWNTYCDEDDFKINPEW